MIEFPAQFQGPRGEIQVFFSERSVPIGWELLVPPPPPPKKKESPSFSVKKWTQRYRHTKRRYRRGIHKR